jgi:hypothetical protein
MTMAGDGICHSDEGSIYNLKSQIPIPKSQILIPKSQILIPKSQTLIPKLSPCMNFKKNLYLHDK